MKAFQNTTMRRICAFVVSVILFTVYFVNRLDSVAVADESLGESGTYEEEESRTAILNRFVYPGVNWLQVDEVLRTGSRYDQQLVLWAVNHFEDHRDVLRRAVEILMNAPTPANADAFTGMVRQLQESRAAGETLPDALGLSGVAQRVSYRLGTALDESSLEGAKAISAFDKIVRETGKFRHYEVEVSVKPQYVGADKPASMNLVLLVDTSVSMQGEKLESIKELLRAVSAQALRAGDSKVCLIRYDDGSEMLSDWVTGEQGYRDMLEKIDALDVGSGTAMQQGIIQARDALDTLDESAVRQDVILHFSDGDATITYTDTNGFLYRDSASDSAEKDHKRWTYVPLGASGAEMSTPAVATKQWSESTDARAVKQRVAILESQYTVAGGVDIYAIDYSGSVSQVLEESTYCMTDAPRDFQYADMDAEQVRAYNPVQDTSYTSEGYRDRVCAAEDESKLLRLLWKLFYQGDFEVPRLTITDTVDSELFELVGEPVLSADHGYESDCAVDGDTIVWTTSGDDVDLVRKLTYTVRVLDKPLLPEGSGDEDISTGANTTLTYLASGKEIRCSPDESQKISVPPLINADAWAENLSGSRVDTYAETNALFLHGAVSGGSGIYLAVWAKTGSEQPLCGPVDWDDIGTALTLEKYGIDDLPEGKAEFQLAVEDRGAQDAGYTADGVARALTPLAVEVVYTDVVVTVNAPEGAFETAVTWGLRDELQTWRFLGPGSQTYRVPTGSTVSATAYAPPGYRVRDVARLAVPPPSANGAVPAQQLEVLIAEAEQPYFYHWLWKK